MEPVIIVGGGVAGCASALALAEQGIHSVVFESRASNGHIDRGDVLHPGVAPTLRRWGLQEELDARIPYRFDMFRVVDNNGRVLLEANTRELLGDDYFFTSLRHPAFVEALRTIAGRTGFVEIRTGERCVSLLQPTKSRVEGIRTDDGVHRAQLTILACGARSRLRDQHFGRPKVHAYRTAFCNLLVQSIEPYVDSAYYVVGKAGVMVLVPLPNGEQRIGIQVKSSEIAGLRLPQDLDRVIVERLRPLAGKPIAQLEPPRIYLLQRAVSPRWWRPGAVLVGDAARQIHPIGGQGMNLAIQDADLLGGLLGSTQTTGNGLDDAGARYERMRQRQVKPALRRTHVLGVAASVPVSSKLAALVRALGRSERLKRTIVRSMMDVR